MELFSEIYGSYFAVVSQVLKEASRGLGREEIEALAKRGAFHESAYHLLPMLFSSEWNFLEEEEGIYTSRINPANRPMSELEKSWLKALLADPRIRLFLDDGELEDLDGYLSNVHPLFNYGDFHFYDKHLDGDDYSSQGYIKIFRAVLDATINRKALVVEYESAKGSRSKRIFHPHSISYSARDDKFRMMCAVYNNRRQKLERATLNLSRISSVEASPLRFGVDIDQQVAKLYSSIECDQPLLLEVSTERNAIERLMLQFASFRRQTEYDKDRDIYICQIWFDPMDETELLIRVLSFGPVVKVLGPESFLAQIKERITRQIELNNMHREPGYV
ncbi:MAG: WYL domain-containing protein [Eubacteriaceae bacterium]|nr:WYL domain-containing protein [Eubacteriaceae bacterium]